VRSVQVIDQSSGSTTRAEHVIGVDESGQVIGPEPFALAVVRCPRENSERLAELLLEHELAPWQAKSQTLVENATPTERNQRVQGLMESLTEESIPWGVAVGRSQESIHHKAAAVCVLAKKTITSVDEFSGDSILIPDGAPSMYGDSQAHLRTQASQVFDGSFQSTFGGVYVTGLPKADLTYPEVTAADYIAGYVRNRIDEGTEQVHTLPEEVVRFDTNWREPSVSPVPFYRIRGVGGDYGTLERTRVAAWIKGRHPDNDGFDVTSQWENTIQMLESQQLQRYLLETIAP